MERALVREFAPCSTDLLFYNGSGSVSRSPSELAGSRPKPDRDALLSLLQFGAIVPPLSPWLGVSRFSPGWVYVGTEATKRSTLPACPLESASVECQADLIESEIDRILTDALGQDRQPVLLFSGGVDSGFLASRLAALGYRDAVLLNCSFGRDDPESALAEEVAKHLGLKFERVCESNGRLDCLGAPGQVYPQPLGDRSTAPSFQFAQAVTRSLSSGRYTVIDGTGADGAFGMGSRLRLLNRLYRIPLTLRSRILACYHERLWMRQDRFEAAARVIARSASMPALSAAIAHNPLAGTFYPNLADRHHLLVRRTVEAWSGPADVQGMIGADLALTCATIFAQKMKPILETAGHTVLFPFLEPRPVALALGASVRWRSRAPKEAIKLSLSRRLPPSLIYRPKSGFVDTATSAERQPDFVEHLRASVDGTGLIGDALKKARVMEACDLLSKAHNLPYQTVNLLWCIVFADRWYRSALPCTRPSSAPGTGQAAEKASV